MGYFVLMLVILFLQQFSWKDILMVLWPTILGGLGVVIAVLYCTKE